MKIKYTPYEGAEVEVEMRKPSAKQLKKIWDFMTAFEEEDLKKVPEYMDYIDKLTSKLSGITIEDLNEKMDIDEKSKFTSVITDRAIDMLGFTKLSMKLGSSGQKTN